MFASPGVACLLPLLGTRLPRDRVSFDGESWIVEELEASEAAEQIEPAVERTILYLAQTELAPTLVKSTPLASQMGELARSQVLSSLDFLSLIILSSVVDCSSAGSARSQLACIALVCKIWSAAVREAKFAWLLAARQDNAGLFLAAPKLLCSAEQVEWRKAAQVLHRTFCLPALPSVRETSSYFVVVTASLLCGEPVFEAAMPFVCSPDGIISASAKNSFTDPLMHSVIINMAAVPCTYCSDLSTVDDKLKNSIQLVRCSLSVVRVRPQHAPEVTHVIQSLTQHGRGSCILPAIPHNEPDAEGFHISFDEARTPTGLSFRVTCPHSEGSVLHGPFHLLASCAGKTLPPGETGPTFSACAFLAPHVTLTLEKWEPDDDAHADAESVATDVPKRRLHDILWISSCHVEFELDMPVPDALAEADALPSPSLTQLTHMLDSLDYFPLTPPAPVCIEPLLQAAGMSPREALAAVLDLPPDAQFPICLSSPQPPAHDWTADETRYLERIAAEGAHSADEPPSPFKVVTGSKDTHASSRYVVIVNLLASDAEVVTASGAGRIGTCGDPDCSEGHMDGFFDSAQAFKFKLELPSIFDAGHTISSRGTNDSIFSLLASIQMARRPVADGDSPEVARLLTKALHVTEYVLDDESARHYFGMEPDDVCAEAVFQVPPSALAPFASGDLPFAIIFVGEEPNFVGYCCPPVQLELRVACIGRRVPGELETTFTPRYWRLKAGVEQWGAYTHIDAVDWLRRYSWQRLPTLPVTAAPRPT